MKPNKDLILSLIKDDLINTQLVNGLNNIGLDAGKYYLRLSQTFFKLMGFGDLQEDEEVYEQYFRFSEKVLTKELIEDAEKLDKVALQVYNQLLKEKEKRKTKTPAKKATARLS